MSANEAPARFLRPSEAAAATGFSTRAIYRAIERGELQAVRICSRLRIPRASFEAWVTPTEVESPTRASRPPAPRQPTVAGGFRELLRTEERE